MKSGGNLPYFARMKSERDRIQRKLRPRMCKVERTHEARNLMDKEEVSKRMQAYTQLMVSKQKEEGKVDKG